MNIGSLHLKIKKFVLPKKGWLGSRCRKWWPASAQWTRGTCPLLLCASLAPVCPWAVPRAETRSFVPPFQKWENVSYRERAARAGEREKKGEFPGGASFLLPAFERPLTPR